MTERERLTEYICEFNKMSNEFCRTHCDMPCYCDECVNLANHLLDNGIIVPSCEEAGKVLKEYEKE